MIISEAEARERLLRSPLRHFNARFNPTETAPLREIAPGASDSNLQSMLEASLSYGNQEETKAEAET